MIIHFNGHIGQYRETTWLGSGKCGQAEELSPCKDRSSVFCQALPRGYNSLYTIPVLRSLYLFNLLFFCLFANYTSATFIYRFIICHLYQAIIRIMLEKAHIILLVSRNRKIITPKLQLIVFTIFEYIFFLGFFAAKQQGNVEVIKFLFCDKNK